MTGALIFLSVVVTAISCSAAEASTCRARFQNAPSWAVSSRDGAGVLLSSTAHSAALRVECTLLPRILNDQEFAAHIGEEEPEEAPPLKKFGSFRGRRWI